MFEQLEQKNFLRKKKDLSITKIAGKYCSDLGQLNVTICCFCILFNCKLSHF